MIKLIIYNIKKHAFLFSLIGVLVMVACFYMEIGLNLLNSVNHSLLRSIAGGQSGDLMIVPRDAPHIDLIEMAGEKKAHLLFEWRSILQFVRQNPHVLVAAPRLRVRAIVRSERNLLPAIVVGVDPEAEPSLLPDRALLKGSWLTAPHEANLYYRHSDRLSMHPGDPLGIEVQTLDGYTNFDTAKLVGTLDYRDLEFYPEISFYTFVSLDFLNDLLQTEKPVVGEILLHLDRPDSTSEVIQSVEHNFKDRYRILTPEKSSFLIESIYRLTHFVFYFIAILLVLMVYLAASLLVHLSLENRRQEIGIYMSLGVSSWRIASLFGGELLLVLSTCSATGVFLGDRFLNTFLSGGIEASITPLQIIFGRTELLVHQSIETYFIIAFLMLLVLGGTILSTIYKLILYKPVELVSEL